jgi:hypothetical protein
LLAQDGVTENTRVEVFVQGTEPVEFAPRPEENTATDFLLEQYGGGGGGTEQADTP